MLSRILALSALSLSLACQSSTTEQAGAVEALNDFEKDFFVAFGDPASWTGRGRRVPVQRHAQRVPLQPRSPTPTTF